MTAEDRARPHIDLGRLPTPGPHFVGGARSSALSATNSAPEGRQNRAWGVSPRLEATMIPALKGRQQEAQRRRRETRRLESAWCVVPSGLLPPLRG